MSNEIVPADTQGDDKRHVMSIRAKAGCKTLGSYLIRKCKESLGLELTKVQSVYWRAVQRRMILSQMEDIIDNNHKIIRDHNIQVPFELAAALIKCDPAIEKYLISYLEERNIAIALPRVMEREEVDTGSPSRLLIHDEADTGAIGIAKQLTKDNVRSIHPNALVRVMKKGNVLMENEEDMLEDKGGFLRQAWVALKFLKNKCQRKKVADDDTDGGEETDSPRSQGIEEADYMYFSSSDDDDELLFDKIYDRERSASPDFGAVGYQVNAPGNEDNADDHVRSRIGGRSLRPTWTAFTEYIPLVVSNFRFKHIVKTGKVYGRSRNEIEETRRRNKEISRERHAKLKRMWNRAARWPLFTYWLILIQTVIFIMTVSVHGFAAVGYVPFTETELVRQADLSVDVLEKKITPNIWIGPPRDALVLLGANYGPCMRRDRLLFQAIDQDREYEATESGCCVRRDGSGCVQVPSEADCPVTGRFTDFVFYDPLVGTSLYTNRSVCGTSPRTCLSPPSSSTTWQVESISDWPICKEAESAAVVAVNDTDQHLTCEVTGRPCCVGIQAVCMITTRENCDFLEGRFHQDAFLCSQVDCLKTICGLTPFAKADNPDQLQRLGLALFLHAGVFHLLVTLIFDFLILRNLEKYLGWLSTCILYMGSGIGGNVISGVFVPYSPEVGPAAAIFGVIAFFFVFIFFHWDMLHSPVFELLKYFAILVLLLMVGFLPYIDNFARFGGLLFGLLFSFVHVHYIPPWKELDCFERFKCEVEGVQMLDNDSKKGMVLKIILLLTGIILIIPLYVFSFAWFTDYQSTWSGFTYFNCIIPTDYSDLCADFGQTIRPRMSP